ncbi:unnamed protein product [Heligmosomoides polygyrus]|uniref:Endo/exonuclease/phosphatase domain-containing protein n=1 Tax=Heligmosomoides polygyrus TaxID=6339 RepID=A0A183FNN5_HELPZ|nr:unnamed protein product [Heligmosomoides polygyrus]
MAHDLLVDDTERNIEETKSRDIGRGFKAVLCGSLRTTSDVGIIVSERFRNSIVSVERFDDRLMKIVVAAKERLFHFFSAYAPQTGCSDQAKDEFWNLLDEKTAEVPSKDVIIVAGDLNGHVGATKDGYSCHVGFGYWSRNTDDHIGLVENLWGKYMGFPYAALDGGVARMDRIQNGAIRQKFGVAPIAEKMREARL